MGALTMSSLLPLLLIFTACHGARNTFHMVAPTTTTSTVPPPTFSVMLATRPSSTMPLEFPPSLPPPCAEATSTISPLGRLRSAMRNMSYTQMSTIFDAFLVFFSDEHLSEEPAPEERRLEYISGWDGAGTAAVLADGGAALWVPSGDVKRARMTVSCAWIVLDADDPSQPTIAEWITEHIRRSARVGGDARLTSVIEWENISASLQKSSATLMHVPNLLDQVWSEEPDPLKRRPEFSRIVANLHAELYTGLSWREKVALLRHEISLSGAEAMIVTSLDEVAWLLNIRGRDIPHSPLLKAFVLVTLKDLRVYAPPGKLSMPVRENLAVYNCFASNNSNCTRVIDYINIYTDLRRLTESRIVIPTAGTFQRGASAAIAQSISQSKRLFLPSPIVYLKAQKNNAEIKGMHQAHLRDAVAMCTLLSYMEGMMKTGLTEISVGLKVDVTRATQAKYVGLSMATRIAFGPSGAEPDYRPNNVSNRRIFTNSTLVIRSGGQYEEGTTVVTRTVHYGTPTREIRTAYTTVLRSLAAMAMLQIPATLPAAHTDPAIRAPLWAAKQDYPHPTGHGVGAALNRREDPVVVDYRQDANLHTFREGYFITNEPAWYEKNKFGVRLGNVLEVVPRPEGYLGFHEATLVPFQPNLIDSSQLTAYEMKWLNAYNDRIRKIVGPELKDQGLIDVYYWMTNNTKRVTPMNTGKPSDATAIVISYGMLVLCVVVTIAFYA